MTYSTPSAWHPLQVVVFQVTGYVHGCCKPVAGLSCFAGLAAYLYCPTVALRLTSDQQPHQSQLAAELKGLSVQLSSSGQGVLEVQQVQLLLNKAAATSDHQGSSNSTAHTAEHPPGADGATNNFVAVLQVPSTDDMRASGIPVTGACTAPAQQQQQQQQQVGAVCTPPSVASTPRPSQLGNIYGSSLINTYLSQLQASVGCLGLGYVDVSESDPPQWTSPVAAMGGAGHEAYEAWWVGPLLSGNFAGQGGSVAEQCCLGHVAAGIDSTTYNGADVTEWLLILLCRLNLDQFFFS